MGIGYMRIITIFKDTTAFTFKSKAFFDFFFFTREENFHKFLQLGYKVSVKCLKTIDAQLLNTMCRIYIHNYLITLVLCYEKHRKGAVVF